MPFVKLEHVQGASSFGNYNPDITMVFRIILSEHPVFEASGKIDFFFFRKTNSGLLGYI